MTKADLVERIAAKVDLSKKDSEHVVNMVFRCIIEALATGDKVELRGFGSFRTRERHSRIGRNPKTGEEIPISARRVVTFRPGQKLKARVEEYAGTEQQQ